MPLRGVLRVRAPRSWPSFARRSRTRSSRASDRFCLEAGGRPTYPFARMTRPEANLSADERDLLAHGLAQWGGPGHATDALARVMGFDDVEGLHREGDRIALALRSGAGLPPADLARALIATEFVFASDYYGAGRDWQAVTGFSDTDTVKRLREVQRKVIGTARLPE